MEFLVPFHYQFLFCVRSNKNEIEKDLERLFTNISELSLGSYLLSYLVYGLRFEFIFVCVELGFVSVKAWIFWIFGLCFGFLVLNQARRFHLKIPGIQGHLIASHNAPSLFFFLILQGYYNCQSLGFIFYL